MSPEREYESKQIAVIDIGSNSVRLVLSLSLIHI